jgi:hypothetical protein
MSGFDRAWLCHGTISRRRPMAVIDSDSGCFSQHQAPTSQHKPNGHDPCGCSATKTTEGNQKTHAHCFARNGRSRPYGTHHIHVGVSILTQKRPIWFFFSGVYLLNTQHFQWNIRQCMSGRVCRNGDDGSFLFCTTCDTLQLGKELEMWEFSKITEVDDGQIRSVSGDWIGFGRRGLLSSFLSSILLRSCGRGVV